MPRAAEPGGAISTLKKESVEDWKWVDAPRSYGRLARSTVYVQKSKLLGAGIFQRTQQGMTRSALQVK